MSEHLQTTPKGGTMLSIATQLQAFAVTAFDRSREAVRREDGQASVEYVGVVIAAAALVTVLIGAAAAIGGQLVAGLQTAISQFLGG